VSSFGRPRFNFFRSTVNRHERLHPNTQTVCKYVGAVSKNSPTYEELHSQGEGILAGGTISFLRFWVCVFETPREVDVGNRLPHNILLLSSSLPFFV
jgi:hypothetical protein